MLPVALFLARQVREDRLDPNDVRNRNAARRRAQLRE
jgi:hypothetical protein